MLGKAHARTTTGAHRELNRYQLELSIYIYDVEPV